MSRHTLAATVELTLSCGGEALVELTVEYEFTPGTPARGPSYASGGEPAEGPEVEIVSARATNPKDAGQGFALPNWLLDQLQADDYLYEELVRNAEEDRGAEHDAALEARAEARRETRDMPWSGSMEDRD